MKSIDQTQLYGLNEYFQDIRKLYDNFKMPNKILFTGKKGIGKATLGYHLVNYIFSKNEDFKYDHTNLKIDPKNKSFKLIQNNSHPNFYLIDLINDKKNIEIDQVRKMINYTNKSSFNNSPRIILIDNVENLNTNSINALLKIIEEPNENIFFILIHNNEKKILPTLKSRCITYKVLLNFEKAIEVSNLILNESLFNLINNDLINYYNSPGDFVNLINFSKDKKINLLDYNLYDFLLFIIDNNFYKKDKKIRELLINYIELYFLKIYKFSQTKSDILSLYLNFINKVNNLNKYNLDEESLFMEFKYKLLNG